MTLMQFLLGMFLGVPVGFMAAALMNMARE